MGGRAHLRVILTLAAALGIQGADFASLSATADNLEHTFGIDNTAIGVLGSVVSLTAALSTIPMGILTDRTRRTRLLTITVALWAVAVAFAGAAVSYTWLLLSRVALGFVTGTTGPAIASLSGDYFPAGTRARMLGFILAGELVGTGMGFVVSGVVAAGLGWRFAFWWLIIPSVALCWLLRRLPEPARGGHSHLTPGQDTVRDEREIGDEEPHERGEDGAGADRDSEVARVARAQGVRPVRELVLHEDPTRRSIWWAVRYVLRVRTNLVIIAASTLGYFFFAGLRAFAIIFVTGHYDIAKSTASLLTLVVGIGALVGVYLGGRTADRLLARQYLNARVMVPAVALFGVAAIFIPALVTTEIALALPLLTAGAGLLGAANPPMDAARLDVMHPALWGRAEGVRTMLRTLGEAAAPTLFGLVSDTIFAGTDDPLEYTLLVFLAPLALAAMLALIARRTYPRDVATVAASRPSARRASG